MSEFFGAARRVSPSFWMDTFLPLLRRSASANVASRLTTAAKRARDKAGVYGVTRPGSTEVAAEVLFDRQLVKPREKNFSRASMHQHLVHLQRSQTPVRLSLPLFSRKPVSPLKNRGPYPDLSEIASLLRCYELAKMLSSIHEADTEFLIFADGHKYRRACGTGAEHVDLYQNALQYWCHELGIDSLVKVLDYESEVHSAIGMEAAAARETQYEDLRETLAAQYDQHFNPHAPELSLATLKAMSAEGEQLSFTFKSIASSVDYRTERLGERIKRGEDDATRLHQAHIAHLLTDLRSDVSETTAELSAEDYDALVALREEAWRAAVRYVAISLVDRMLDVWTVLTPSGIKMTIHGKPGEVQIRPTHSDYASISAQHCVGGLMLGEHGTKVTYRYALEHEHGGDVPLLFEEPLVHGASTTAPLPDPIQKMIDTHQPVCYLRPDDGAPWEVLSDRVVDF